MKESTATRLKRIMEERNLKQVDVLRLCEPYCEKYGVKLKKNDLSQYLSGKVQPKQNKLSILGMALGVQEAWLMGYDVPMRPTENNGDLTKRALAYYEIFNNLPPEKQTAFLNYLKFLQSDS